MKRADSGAGKGGWKKRMLHCNDADTDGCLTRKCAHFQLVSHCKMIWKTLFKKERR
ncbi:hypothetical protein VIBHAR_06868 [Vibrio campbellii ATCC BAA-1116]|uniref:Uncharacterized protein n=1 Tax=Vibrio campbellii (strain ATCC BAA-1116) TaxID=2902295 RepID=A7N274_VIBC1|nr:hypothetical protein VIBHAR_06165 [Vibrio campbellii ATCC BAA-1116]ABU74634.1 hypothetical protein VIBHAR_06751 [Vibrio campbellii ATCC BAA-1116]ABU74743.1 hypothetical protein VIBHAR_06868 [Vibrio campbellii ATCC BAA-1116]